MNNFILSILFLIFLLVVNTFTEYYQIMKSCFSTSSSSSTNNNNYSGGNELIDKKINNEEFPYRKYELEPYVKNILKILLDADESIKSDIYWSIPDKKVKKLIPNDIYFLSNIVVSSSLNNHWDYDKIVDYYCEEARIKTPGYGEKYSLYDYWYNLNLHSRWTDKKSTLTPRELMYKSIQEARPAYISVSKSLYAFLSKLNDKKNNDKISILDIAAYGERAIAAIGLDYKYTGVDPNYDLIEGHNKIIMDLKLFKPSCDISFYYIGLEDFKSNEKYDIITYSPPPFNTEPYGNNQKTQSYIKYPTFEEYLCCFLTELIYKAKKFSNENTIFSFTALDRDSSEFYKNIDKKYISDNLELIYVEALLLITSCFGFDYIGAIGYSVGNKPARVPWWTFNYKNLLNKEHIKLLRDYYPKIYNIIGFRILSNITEDNNNLFNYHTKISNFINFKISKFINKSNKIDNDKLLLLEIIRYYIQKYVILIIKDECKILSVNKIKNLLGKYLTLRSITATFDKPWYSCLYVDPVFPTKCDYVNINDIEKYIIDYLLENNVNDAEEIIKSKVYWFKSYECKGISDLYNTIANYITTIPLSNVKLINNSNKIIGNDYTIKILKEIPGFIPYNNYVWNNKDSIIKIRYDTLGLHGHHFTRPKERTNILNKAFDLQIVDIYASFYNNQSEYYCSIYPDIETKSYGSAFTLKMIKGGYLANPVDIPIFLNISVNNIINDLENSEKDKNSLIISMAFTIWLDINKNFETDFNKLDIKNLFQSTDNLGLQIISEHINFVKFIYILDSKKFPPVDLSNKKIINNTRDTISVGVILATSVAKIKYNILEELAKEKYFKKNNK